MGLDWPGAWPHLEQHSLSPFPAGKWGMKSRHWSRSRPMTRCLQGKLRNGCICRLHHHLLPQGWKRRRQGGIRRHQETSEEQEPKGTKARCAQKLERLKGRDTFEQRWETLRSKNFFHSILLGNVITLFFYLSFLTYLKVWVGTCVCVDFWSVKSIPQASHHLFSNYLF